MPLSGSTFLLDENVPVEVAAWLRDRLPDVGAVHITHLGLAGAKDLRVMEEATRLSNAIVVTYDEDLADQRRFPVGSHGGVIRLRVDPTTAANTIVALDRVFAHLTMPEIARRLVIVDETRIRVVSPIVPARGVIPQGG